MSHAYQDLKTARTDVPILPAIARRWSPRAFSEQAPPTEHLRQCFEAARWAASSFNEQPWRFYVGLRSNATWQAIYDALSPFNQQWCAPVPVLILAAARTHFSHNDHPNRHALHDVGQALAYLALQATELGLYTHMMAGFDPATAQHLLALPAELTPATVVALGYAGDPAYLSESHASSEQSPRTRRSLEELVFGGPNGLPFDWAN